MAALRTLLVFPPQFAMYSPFLSIPTVTAFVRAQGYHCDQIDLNLLVNRRLLSEFWLRRCAELIQSRPIAAQGQDALDRLENIIDQLPAALAAIKKRENLLDDEVLGRGFGLLDAAYSITNAAFAPTQVSYNLSMRYAMDKYDDIELAVCDENENPYLELFRNEFVPQIVAGHYDVVGIGMSFDEQLVPSLTLAKVLKEMAPSIHVVAGGTLLTKLAEPLQRLNKLFTYLDTAVLFEGETPMVRLLDHLAGEIPREAVPNLLYRKDDRPDGDLVLNTPSYERVDELPAPDFDGFPLDDYLLPDVIYPMLTTRGCYWKKCAFCTHHHSYGWHYRVRKKPKLVADVQSLQERFGARYFYFVDEAVPPSNLKVLADYGQTEEGKDIRWFGDMRFERQLMHDDFCKHLFDGGCRSLIFGMESASQRILDHMLKGVEVETMSESLKAMHRNNIFTILMYFIGFPTETVQDARDSVNFIKQHREQVGAFALGHFQLLEGSPVFVNPEKFGVTALIPPENDLATDYRYRVRSGINQTSASQIATAVGRQRLMDAKFGQNWSRELILLRESARFEAERTDAVEVERQSGHATGSSPLPA